LASAMAPKRRYYQFTAIDDCTRLRVLRLYERCNQKTAIQFVDYVAERLFPIEVIQTEQRFRVRAYLPLARSGQGNQPRLHQAGHPATQRKGGAEPQDFYRRLEGELIDDTKVFNDKLREWEDYYNYHRPHGGLGGQTPLRAPEAETTTEAPRSR
jgi:Integrase core domain